MYLPTQLLTPLISFIEFAVYIMVKPGIFFPSFQTPPFPIFVVTVRALDSNGSLIWFVSYLPRSRRAIVKCRSHKSR